MAQPGGHGDPPEPALLPRVLQERAARRRLFLCALRTVVIGHRLGERQRLDHLLGRPLAVLPAALMPGALPVGDPPLLIRIPAQYVPEVVHHPLAHADLVPLALRPRDILLPPVGVEGAQLTLAPAGEERSAGPSLARPAAQGGVMQCSPGRLLVRDPVRSEAAKGEGTARAGLVDPGHRQLAVQLLQGCQGGDVADVARVHVEHEDVRAGPGADADI
jgi:hypothetical protein